MLTIDQRASRRGPDRVGAMLERLNGAVPVVLAFERTAGDEFQGVLDDPRVAELYLGEASPVPNSAHGEDSKA